MTRANQKSPRSYRPGRFVALAAKLDLPAAHPSRPARGAILHPTDFSEPSRQALELACRIARERGSRLIVLHVAEPAYACSLGMAPLPPLPKRYRGAWESRLRLVRPRTPGVQVEHRLEEGDVAAAVLRVAREARCGLIVMSGREPTLLRRLLAGSVTGAVERNAACPVVRLHLPAPGNGGGRIRPRTILHPTDFSPEGRHGLAVARSLAREFGSDLIIAHIARTFDVPGNPAFRDETEAALRRMAEVDPTVRTRWALRTGDPAPATLALAREGRCDLIVVGTRRKTALGQLVGSNTAADLRLHSACPVLSVTAPPGRPAAGRAVRRDRSIRPLGTDRLHANGRFGR